MTLYELTKKYGQGKGEPSMWATIDVVSRTVEDYMSDEEKQYLKRKVFSIMSSGHYNEDFAREDIKTMYYVDKNGEKHYAPYWPELAVKRLYDEHADKIRDYNFWDFLVTISMLASDNWCMLSKWFPGMSESDMNEKFAEMAVSWLDDDDWPTKTKIWDYMSSR